MTKNRILILALLLAPAVPAGLIGQTTEAKKEEAKQAEAKQEQEASAASPAPAAEQNFSFMADFGYRWKLNDSGNLNTYRSVVNLGEGPRLFGLDMRLTDPKSLLFDQVDIRAHGWGNEPWETTRLDARKRNAYNLSIDYRNLAYFSYLPSYSNPKLAQGSLLSQRTFDTRMRLADVNLELRPGSWLRPFLNWNYAGGTGGGMVNYVLSGNEYPVSNWNRTNSNVLRGGVYMERKLWHLTLEQGGIYYRDDTQAFTTGSGNAGNVTGPFFGQTQVLNNLQQLYGVRGRSIFNRGLFTANPFSWLDISAGLLYSQPWSDTNYIENSAGRFLLLNSLTFYTGQQWLTNADSKLPRSSGNVSAEVRPARRVRIIETWFTDRLHNASSAFLTEQYLLSGNNLLSRNQYFSNRLIWNYNQQAVDVLVDILPKVTLRAGHRYVWGDVSGYGGFLSTQAETAKLARHAGIAGFNYHATQKLHSNLDFEVGRGDRNYFRTSIQNYTRMRFRQRYQVREDLSLNLNYTLLDNKNPLITSQYDFQSQEAGASVLWNPAALKRASILGEYTYSRLRSDVSYLDPSILQPLRSFYREQAHTGNALLDINGPKIGANAVRFSAGGSFFTGGGTRPADYYQPMMRLLMPVHKNAAVRAEWRWYSLSQSLYRYEGFGSHLFLISLQLMR